jgi:[protein-PII] uridylyltransferase
MTPWRLEQLWRVYLTAAEQLTRDLEIDRIHNVADPSQSVFGDQVTLDLQKFLEGLPTRYLRTHSEDEIRHQMGLLEHAKSSGVVVEIKRHVDAWQALVLAKDHPGLFSKICGALASAGMNIVKAEAASNVEGVVVDEFRFADPLRTLELNPSEVDQLRLTLERVVRGTVQVEDLLKRRRAPVRPSRGSRIQPTVRFNQQASDSSTLIDFIGEDRPGLLYDLTAAMSQTGCNIEVVMIDTEAHKALDVFYVTKGGEKLTEDEEETLRAALLEAALRA